MKTKATRQGKKKTKMSMAQKKERDDNRKAQKQLGDALLAFHQAQQTEKMKSNRESAAPRRERDLLEVFTEYKSRLKETRLELDTAKQNTATYDSDDSDVVNLKREIALCKKKRDEIFALLSESDLK
jgi:small-conductance mechanosensitive channel